MNELFLCVVRSSWGQLIEVLITEEDYLNKDTFENKILLTLTQGPRNKHCIDLFTLFYTKVVSKYDTISSKCKREAQSSSYYLGMIKDHDLWYDST